MKMWLTLVMYSNRNPTSTITQSKTRDQTFTVTVSQKVKCKMFRNIINCPLSLRLIQHNCASPLKLTIRHPVGLSWWQEGMWFTLTAAAAAVTPPSNRDTCRKCPKKTQLKEDAMKKTYISLADNFENMSGLNAFHHKHKHINTAVLINILSEKKSFNSGAQEEIRWRNVWSQCIKESSCVSFIGFSVSHLFIYVYPWYSKMLKTITASGVQVGQTFCWQVLNFKRATCQQEWSTVCLCGYAWTVLVPVLYILYHLKRTVSWEVFPEFPSHS